MSDTLQSAFGSSGSANAGSSLIAHRTHSPVNDESGAPWLHHHTIKRSHRVRSGVTFRG
jgi:hypothetical protein